MTSPAYLQDPIPVSAQEIRFRRLLHSCQSLLTGSRASTDPDRPTTQQELNAGVSTVKLKGYVDALNDQLSDVERSCGLPKTTLDIYRQHVKAITAKMQPPVLPAYCQNLKGSSLAAQLPGGSGPPSIRLPQLPGSAPPTSALWNNSSHLSTATADRLSQQEHIQEALTSELAGMAATLKEGMLGVQGAVTHRGQVLEQTEQAMDDSVASAQAIAARSKEQVKRGSGNLCLTILILLLVAGGFTGMVVWIKFTSLVGLGRARRLDTREL